MKLVGKITSTYKNGNCEDCYNIDIDLEDGRKSFISIYPGKNISINIDERKMNSIKIET